jgi:hypothetical protein
MQQCVPVPPGPQRPFEHWSFAEHVAPAAPSLASASALASWPASAPASALVSAAASEAPLMLPEPLPELLPEPLLEPLLEPELLPELLTTRASACPRARHRGTGRTDVLLGRVRPGTAVGTEQVVAPRAPAARRKARCADQRHEPRQRASHVQSPCPPRCSTACPRQTRRETPIVRLPGGQVKGWLGDLMTGRIDRRAGLQVPRVGAAHGGEIVRIEAWAGWWWCEGRERSAPHRRSSPGARIDRRVFTAPSASWPGRTCSAVAQRRPCRTSIRWSRLGLGSWCQTSGSRTHRCRRR